MANEKRLVNAEAIARKLKYAHCSDCHVVRQIQCSACWVGDVLELLEGDAVDAVEVVHGRWELTAHKESCNCRWNVKAECSECHHRKGEVYAGFFVGFHDDVVRDTILDNAKSVKLDNYCPNCGAKMDGDGNV